MFGAVDIKHPKLLPALRESMTAVRRRGAPGKIKALCRVEEPKPGLVPKPCGKPKVSGNRPLANRLDCSAYKGGFANDLGVGVTKGEEREKITRRRRDTEVSQRRTILTRRTQRKSTEEAARRNAPAPQSHPGSKNRTSDGGRYIEFMARFRAVSSVGVRGRWADLGRWPRWRGPMETRMRRRTSMPKASSMRRMWRFLPSSRVS